VYNLRQSLKKPNIFYSFFQSARCYAMHTTALQCFRKCWTESSLWIINHRKAIEWPRMTT